MYRPARIPTLAALAVLALCLALPALAAPEKAPDDEVGFLAGVGRPDADLTGSSSKGMGPLFGVRYGRDFTDTIGASADFLYGYRYNGQLASGDWNEMSLGASMDWYFGTTKKTRWFLSPGFGWSRFKPDTGDTVTRGFLSAAIGQKIWPGDPEANVRWLFRADQTVGSSGLDGAGVLTYRMLLAASWGIGGPPPDKDEDGVFNRKDKCPDTPKGATVDAKGCPKDSDGDGVLDGIDTCPDTPKGWPIDAKGCPTDKDGDGVPDGADKCPDTPKGATVDASGCPKDSDGDGVLDGLDKCASTPKGAVVDATGCPKDTDGDGVFDGLDKCPDTPKGKKVDAEGCPLPEKAPPLFTPEKKSLVLEGVTFEYDKTTLTPGSLAVLDTVATSLRDWPEVKVEVDGHTDSRGGTSYNLKLSEGRAAAVRDYLVSKGIDASRLTSKGFGKAKPIATNDTEEGRAKNRRVELTKVD